tara:strand:- start:1744 stop:2322 length:579 start_codon:yes stop_codon:yes gene_type:complete
MKQLFTFLAILSINFSSIAQSQTFTLNNSDRTTFPNQFIALEVDSLSIEEGYKRTIEWINITYNTPSEVIKSSLDNKYIRIQGVASNLYTYDPLGSLSADVRYSIEFAFKDNRVKFDVTGTEFYISPSQYAAGGWTQLNFNNSKMYRKNGKPKKSAIKKSNQVMGYFNELAESLNSYLNKPIEKSVTENDDW